jgi:hypothetical protein
VDAVVPDGVSLMPAAPAPFRGVALIQLPLDQTFMDTECLDRLAHQLRIGGTAACRRAINRILEEVRKGCESGEYGDPTEAEAAFRKVVEEERSCQKAKAV